MLVVVAMVASVLGLGAAPASAAEKWNGGSTKYTTITNCPSIIWGSPYQEFGIGAFVSYWGDQQSDPITPVTGNTTYLNLYAMLVGSHCSTPKLFPRFVLPSGVEFDKTQRIRCFYTPPGPGTQREITLAAECPQWSNVSANGYYSSSQTGWSGGWPLPAGQNYMNGSAWEFWVPVRATSQQWGSQLTAELGIADGNAGPTLNLSVPFYTAPPPVTAPGAPTNVAANATSPTSAQVSFNPPANNGGAAINGYTARCESPTGGVTQTATGGGSPINVTGLSPNQTYACDVRATNNVGSGSWSNKTGNFNTPQATAAPGAPTSVVTNVVSATTSRVTFNPPANDGNSPITGYRAQCTSPNGGTSRTVDGTSSPITFTNLTPGKDYRCRVNARNAVGTGSYSAYSATVTQPATRPDRPTNVTATAATRTSAKVTFAPPAYNGGAAITSYRVQCASSNGGLTRTADGTTSPVTVTRLTAGKAYRCRVKATNAAGASAYSAYSARFNLPA
ncbi:fibronectin type III domain-containing protein [Nocardioides bizhenqiangii]|uniref:Fibronectin type III domain-containing protein n=1 Tax=Nocardioides bizhenqiangii TaxID=3095076 RepID=A0ABZ0ZRJ2_9ACTN|nr:fibronectin type III domain-containing protein [Nocardioides sp. HM61]WQQ26093.1 fibronectin type III domain-containing protein [Nocardioides sp. HM61]